MKLTTIIIISAFATLLSTINLLAQNVDEIINKHIEARGGVENWNKIETLKITGTLTGFSTVKNFTTIQKQPNLYRSDFGLGKFDVVLSYNGESGWTIDPWFDVSFPRVLNSSEENVVLQKAEICSPFLNYKQKGYVVEFLGKEKVEGIEVFKLKLVRENNRVETWYLNADTYLEFKQESVWDDFGYPTPQETFFDDFRSVENVTMPFYVERSFLIRNRITEISKVEINQQVSVDYFQMPVSVEMKKLEFMTGNWTIKVTKQGRKGWRVVDSTSTQITLKNNLIEMELSYENYFKYINQINLSYNSKSGVYDFYIYDSFSSKMDLLHGHITNDTLELKNDTFQKFLIINSANNSFKLESQVSNDEGKSWSTSEKIIFNKIVD